VLYTVNTDGSGLTQITNSPGREEGAPAWSPDGTRLAFLGCFSNNCDLIVRNADGTGGETTLLHGGAGAPDWQALPHSISAPGSGGDSIAHAPELSLRQQHVATRSGGPDYWRVTLRRGDELTVEVGAAGNGSLRLCILSPKITDDTSDNAVCDAVATMPSGGKHELSTVASASGRWTLAIDGCTSCDRVFHPNDRTDVSYTLTAIVRRYTRVAAHAPHSVRVGSWFALSGRVEGAGAGQVELQRRRAVGWGLLATRTIRSDGSFTVRTRFSVRSRRLTLRLLYRGDAGHLPSATTLAISVH
jgi:hypothetical protein